MKQIIFAIFLINTFFGYSKPHKVIRTPKNDSYVIVLSLDGFRTSYLETCKTPNLDSISEAGVKSTFIPSFPSLTFPNHYAMATGLYPENNGIIHNKFRTKEGVEYTVGNRKAVENPTFYKGEPIWNTAEKQGIKTASFYWVGSETKINGRQPSIWKKFDSSVPFQSRGDSVISWLKKPENERPHLIMWYIEEPDHCGHINTPESNETKKTVEMLDKIVGDFCNKLNQLPIASKVDFVIVSDHGMATYDPKKYINLSAYLPRDSFEYVVDGAPTLLYPKKTFTNKAIEILKNIPNIKVWNKDDVPQKYHYGKNKDIGQIVILPDVGTQLEFSDSKKASKTLAAHGYDNFSPEMQAIFIAAGPSFKKNITAAPIPNVNLYLLICKLLNIKPSKNDGDGKQIKKMLKN